MKFIYSVIVVLMFVSCSKTVYIVRHAEKEAAGANMSGDVPLSRIGTERAEGLKILLEKKKIRRVYSTNTIRTVSTAKPTAEMFGLEIQFYPPKPDDAFISTLKKGRGNALVVGHSNTVDDIANMLSNKKVLDGDLPETEYDNLFWIKIKGKRTYFNRMKFDIAAK